MADRKPEDTRLKSTGTEGEPDPEVIRFIYRGNAVGVAGRITRVDPLSGLDHVFPSHAVSALAATGGRSEYDAGHPSYFKITRPEPREMFYVGHAHSLATGAWDPQLKAWVTSVQCQVQDLHILGGKIAVERLFVNIVKKHGPTSDAPTITLSDDCNIAGLSLDGRPVTVKINVGPFREAPTMAGLRDRVKADGELSRRIGWMELKPASAGIAASHIVESVSFPEGKPEDVEWDPKTPNRIVWRGVGKIYLGELLVTDVSRRLTMLRVQLGSPVAGDVSAGEVETNGHTLP
jgi:hypothetical protein